jgi:hypothetical protein
MDEKLVSMLIDNNGNTVWTPATRDLSTFASTKYHLKTSDYNSGQWLALWGDDRNDAGDIYGQNMKPDGTVGPVAVPFTISVDSLVFDTYQQCLQGLPFTITNPDVSGINITTLDNEGTYPYNEGHWYVYPAVTVPFALTAGESRTIQVKMDSFVGGDVLNYLSDTMYISGTSGNKMLKILLNEAMFVRIKDAEVQRGLMVYPNPANNLINIDFELAKAETVRFEIFNATGKSVLQTEKSMKQGANKISLQVKDLPSGYYTCVVRGMDSGAFQKTGLIKN